MKPSRNQIDHSFMLDVKAALADQMKRIGESDLPFKEKFRLMVPLALAIEQRKTTEKIAKQMAKTLPLVFKKPISKPFIPDSLFNFS